jgi:hypothetical protein
VEYLQTIYPQWFIPGEGTDDRVKEGGNPESGVVPEVMLHKNLLPNGFNTNLMHSIGKVGMYHFDLSSTVTAGILQTYTKLT